MLSRKFLLAMLLVIQTGMTAQESILIGAGDKLHVHVFDTPEMEQHPQVTDEGTIPMMLLGEVKVGGMTPAQAAEAIEKALISEKVMVHPQVTVTIDDDSSGEVYIMGQVKDAGSYEITTPTPILKVLALAGGLTDLADRHISVEHRNDPAKKEAYFLSNDSAEALSNNFLVYPGDTVLVPKVGIVYVIGDVNRPGGFPIPTNDGSISLLQVLALAGSTNKTALADRTVLIRHTASGTEEIPLHLAAIEKGRSTNPQLKPDDIVFVPFSWMKNMAVGASQIAASTGSAAIYAVK